MKRIRISQNRSDIAAALREAVIKTGAAVSGIIRDTNDTPTHFTDAFVFITDSDNFELPPDCAGLVTIREIRDGDPTPVFEEAPIEAPAEVTPEPEEATEETTEEEG